MAARIARLTATSLALSLVSVGGIAARAPDPARVEKLLAKQDFAAAVTAAEAMVAADPRAAAKRALLGRAYLSAGRFASAETAYAEALDLAPDWRSALNLALTRTALGKLDAARAALEAHRDIIPGPDYGLALALAGDVDGAVRTLEAVTRAPGGDAKARQNLALAYAMQGQWLNARVMAVQDLSPADTDARIIEWATFVRPAAQADQVAALMGVRPAPTDAGRPERLALAPVAVATAPVQVAQAAPVEAAPEVASTVEQVAAAAVAAPKIVFAAMREVVQPLPPRPAPLVRALAPPKPYVPPRPVAANTRTGRYVVQLGAYPSPAIAQAAWARSSGRLGLASFTPASSNVRINRASHVRLSVGTFAERGAAAALCQRVQRAGGACFVRTASGDQPAIWAKRTSATQVAGLR